MIYIFVTIIYSNNNLLFLELVIYVFCYSNNYFSEEMYLEVE